MLKRILEPEVMDSVEDAVDYDVMDHAEVNRMFVDDLLAALSFRDIELQADSQILDVGTGTAQIPIEYCRQSKLGRIVATDLAEEMLKVASLNLLGSGDAGRIKLLLSDAKRLTASDGSYDVVMSNSIVHHIPEPSVVVAEMLRVLKPGGLLFVRDLMRPADQDTLDHLVAIHAGDESEHARQMFRDSLHAALTVDEVREILRMHRHPEDWVCQTSDRHWTVGGVKPK